MKYNFKYKSPFEKKKIQERAGIIFLHLTIFLYKTRFFKKFKLDKNRFIRNHIRIDNTISQDLSSKELESLKLNIYSVTFIDCIENEDANQLKNKLIKVASKYERGRFSRKPSESISEAFDKFDSSYRNVFTGNIYYNIIKNKKELDLIKGISYSYVKGEHSHFIMSYTVYPSEKFHLLFKESLKANINKELIIIFNSFKDIIKGKGMISSLGYSYKNQGYPTEKLLNEINYQIKSKITKELKLGIFNSNKELLFPRIVSFEYDPKDFSNQKNNLFRFLKADRHEYFNFEDKFFTLKKANHFKLYSNSLELLFSTELRNNNDEFNKIEYLSENYINAIAPFWLLINVTSLNKQTIILLRKQIYIYIRKNRVTLFLKKAITLKNRLSLDWIRFERIRKDFSSEIFKSLLTFQDIPDAVNTPWNKAAAPSEYKSTLRDFALDTSNDIKQSYEEILELFKHINDDNTIRANMNLQKILLGMTILGILLAIYGANVDWFNDVLIQLVSRLKQKLVYTSLSS